MEVAVHPAHRTPARRAPVGVLLQQRAAFQQAVAGQFVERVGGAVAAYAAEQVVDEGEGVGGVGGDGFGTGTRVCRHHPLQARVHHSQQRPQPAALDGRELSAVPVPSLDPGVQRVGVSADHRDRAPVPPGQRGRHRYAQIGQALGGPVLTGDRGRVGGLRVEVVLEEVAAVGGAQAIAPVEQALVDGLAGDGGTGAVLAQQFAQRGRVRHMRWYRGAQHAPDGRARFKAVSWALSQAVAFGHGMCSKWRSRPPSVEWTVPNCGSTLR